MKMTKEMLNRINELAEELFWDYEYVGVRVQEESFELGAMDHISHVWDDGEDTGVELGGLSILSAKDAKLANCYYGEHIAVIAGNDLDSYGEDVGELILRDPTVIEILA